jgi:hypothetical protein
MSGDVSQRSRGVAVLFVVGAILLVGGVTASVIEGIRLATPTPMPTLPVGAYTGYHYPTSSVPLTPIALAVTSAAAILGLVIIMIALTARARASRTRSAPLAR